MSHVTGTKPGIGRLLIWIGIGILAATLYGILNDQITVTIAPEYFSVFKRMQFAPILEQTGLQEAPTRVQAILVGTMATWWFGLFLGIVLSFSGLVGRRPPLSTRDFLRAVVGIMVFTLGLSILWGAIAYLAEPQIKPDSDHWPFLYRIQAIRPAFAIGFWHDGAYLGGFIGTIGASLWAQYRRRKAKIFIKSNPVDTSATTG